MCNCRQLCLLANIVPVGHVTECLPRQVTRHRALSNTRWHQIASWLTDTCRVLERELWLHPQSRAHVNLRHGNCLSIPPAYLQCSSAELLYVIYIAVFSAHATSRSRVHAARWLIMNTKIGVRLAGLLKARQLHNQRAHADPRSPRWTFDLYPAARYLVDSPIFTTWRWMNALYPPAFEFNLSCRWMCRSPPASLCVAGRSKKIVAVRQPG